MVKLLVPFNAGVWSEGAEIVSSINADPTSDLQEPVAAV